MKDIFLSLAIISIFVVVTATFIKNATLAETMQVHCYSNCKHKQWKCESNCGNDSNCKRSCLQAYNDCMKYCDAKY